MRKTYRGRGAPHRARRSAPIVRPIGAGRPPRPRAPAGGGARLTGRLRELPAASGVETAAARAARATRAEWIPPGDEPPPSEPPEWPPDPPQVPPPGPDEVPVEDPEELPGEEPDDSPEGDFRSGG